MSRHGETDYGKGPANRSSHEKYRNGGIWDNMGPDAKKKRECTAPVLDLSNVNIHAVTKEEIAQAIKSLCMKDHLVMTDEQIEEMAQQHHDLIHDFDGDTIGFTIGDSKPVKFKSYPATPQEGIPFSTGKSDIVEQLEQTLIPHTQAISGGRHGMATAAQSESNCGKH